MQLAPALCGLVRDGKWCEQGLISMRGITFCPSCDGAPCPKCHINQFPGSPGYHLAGCDSLLGPTTTIANDNPKES